ncbi:MAG: 5-formyltetrahydrofolate cyclo-ligase [Ruminococcus sp.]|nr:5-formyltetrahydrofolate cyclo-ligase [Ruminococcus sp.]
MKKDLRIRYKLLRESVKDKKTKDLNVCFLFLSSDLYYSSNLIIGYYPVNSEINILPIIYQALKDKKYVALPHIINTNGDMAFYYITSLNNLRENAFKIPEPDTATSREVLDFNNSVCLIPGLTFDNQGYRLGYGKGYYDRFLTYYQGISIGVCYEELINKCIPINGHDKSVDYLLTEKALKRVLK